MATTRNNYGTYIPVEAIDWGKAVGGLYKTVTDIGESREKERQDLDKLMTDSLNTINNTDMLKTQSLNDYILAGAENGRSTIKSANDRLKAGEITPKEYRAIINNVNTYWSTMGNSMKNFDATNQELLKRLQPGADGSAPEGSEFEEYLAQQHANLGDIRNSSYMFNPNTGEGYMVKINPQTGTPEKITNSMTIANPSNIMDQRFDFESTIKNNVKGMTDAYTREFGNEIITDPMKNESVSKSIASLVISLTNNDRMTSQVLARYAGYQYYKTEAEKNQIIQSSLQNKINEMMLSGKKSDEIINSEEYQAYKNELESSLIQVSLDDNNVEQPIITSDQKLEAQEILKDYAIAQFPYKRLEDEPRFKGGSGSGGGGGGSKITDSDTNDLAVKFVSALSNKKTAEESLNDLLTSRGLQVDWNGSGWDVYKYNPNKKITNKYGTQTGAGGYDKTQYINLRWNAEEFWKALGLNETKWKEAVRKARRS